MFRPSRFTVGFSSLAGLGISVESGSVNGSRLSTVTGYGGSSECP